MKITRGVLILFSLFLLLGHTSAMASFSSPEDVVKIPLIQRSSMTMKKMCLTCQPHWWALVSILLSVTQFKTQVVFNGLTRQLLKLPEIVV